MKKLAVTVLLLMAAAAPAAPTTPLSPVPAEKGGSSIEFNGTPVDMVFKVYQDLVGKTVLKDPGVPAATITLQPKKGQDLTDDDKIRAIETVLEMNGIHIEPYGEKFMRAMPRKSARKEGIPLVLEDAQFDNVDKVVSTIISFKVISVDVGEKILKEFLSEKSGPLQVFKHTNSILVTDTMQNINRMRELMKEIDRKLPPTKVAGEWFVYVLKYATADNVEKALQSAYEYDKKRVEEMNKALETPEKATSTGAGGAPQLARSRQILGGLARSNAGQAASRPADSVVAGSSPYVVGMLPTMPLFIYDIENSPDRLVVYTTREEKEKVYDKIVEQLDVPAIPDKVVKVYRLKYAEAEDVSDMINDLINKSSGNRSDKSEKKTTGTTRPAQQQQAQSASKQAGDGKVGELNPINTQVLADKRINGLVVQTLRSLVPTIEKIIESMDIKLSQVLVETVIIEVGLTDGMETGIDWVNQAWTGKDPMVMGGGGGGSGSGTLELLKGTGTTKTYSEWAAEAKSVLQTTASGGGLYSGATPNLTPADINAYIENAQKFAKNSTDNLNPTGQGITYLLKSDKLNLSAVLHAAKTDGHSKYIASPVIMTLDNKEATIDATEMKYLFKGYQYSGSTQTGSPVKDYEQKDIGIKIKVKPKINPNGTVMLTVEEEYSQVGAPQEVDGQSQETTITRKMSADALLENGQTVVFAGLTQTRTSDSAGGIPILKDIPLIGKWLFGYTRNDESRNELLVFMTPYVLDDAQAAQAEALRRKKSMSDPRPWDDHGWSASEIADPVSKREQMRRIKEEWRIQDEERRTKIAIEKAKVERAKRLKAMSKEERDLWLKMHKSELEDDEQEELEEKMLDEKSQEELKKLAAEIRAKKLGDAEKDLKSAEKESAVENERARLEAEKKAKEEVK